jgi:hypothetical protein
LACPTKTTPPIVDPEELPVRPTFDPLAMKYPPSMVRLLNSFPMNVPTTPCNEAGAEIPEIKHITSQYINNLDTMFHTPSPQQYVMQEIKRH